MTTLETNISFFPSPFAKRPESDISLEGFISDVKNGRWATRIRPLRAKLHNGNPEDYTAEKRKLPAVTISCTCDSRDATHRAEEKNIIHSGFLQADFDLKDNLILSDPDTVASLRATLIADPHVAAVFVGPSGEGLKAVVRIDPDRHKDSWHAAEAYFREKFALTLDRATKDPQRLCFVSYDPAARMSEDFRPLPLPAADAPEEDKWFPPLETTESDIADMLAVIPPRPDYDTWLRIASAVWSVLPMIPGAKLLNKWSPEEREGEYTGKHKARLKQIGVGTLIHIAAQHGYDARAASRRKQWAGRITFAGTPGKDGLALPGDSAPPEPTIKITRERIIDALEAGQIGDAQLWIDARKGTRMFNQNAKTWTIYEDGAWEKDTGNQNPWNISRTLSGIYSALAASVRKGIKASPPPDKKKDPREKEIDKIQTRIASLGKWDYLVGVSKFAQGVLSCPATHFDVSPTIMTLSNGTIDLSAKIFREHLPGDLATIRTAAHYDPDATAPRWQAFLETILPDPETRAYLARAVGYSLTGLVHHDVVFFCYGKGANGKSTFFAALKMLLGEFMTTIPIAAILSGGTDPAYDYHRACVEGKRLVLTDEIPEGKRLADAQVKALVGGDAITARRPYEIPYVFQPTHKLWVAGNHKPDVRGTDGGIWRRVHLIPFTVTIPEADRRPRHEMLAEFQAELPGILNWAIAGLLDTADAPLLPPPQVLAATQDYRNENDILGTFLSECTESSPTSQTPVRSIAKALAAWCEANGETMTLRGTRKLRAALDERNIPIGLDRQGTPQALGLRLRDQSESAAAFTLN